MEQICLNDLPKYTDLVDTLLKLESWDPDDRDIETVRQEYDQEKFKSLRQAKEVKPELGPTEIRSLQNHMGQEEPVCISQDRELYLASIEEVQRVVDQRVTEQFEGVVRGGETIVELGSGYGYNLFLLADRYPDCSFVGCDFSENALTLGRELAEDHANISFKFFDFYDEDWSVLDEYDDVILFTRLSIEQLPNADPVFGRPLETYLDRIRTGIHVESVFEFHPDTLLGSLRKSYTEYRDYNRDLLSTLREIDEVTIAEQKYDVVGTNPLHPMSIIRWETGR